MCDEIISNGLKGYIYYEFKVNVGFNYGWMKGKGEMNFVFKIGKLLSWGWEIGLGKKVCILEGIICIWCEGGVCIGRVLMVEVVLYL